MGLGRLSGRLGVRGGHRAVVARLHLGTLGQLRVPGAAGPRSADPLDDADLQRERPREPGARLLLQGPLDHLPRHPPGRLRGLLHPELLQPPAPQTTPQLKYPQLWAALLISGQYSVRANDELQKKIMYGLPQYILEIYFSRYAQRVANVVHVHAYGTCLEQLR